MEPEALREGEWVAACVIDVPTDPTWLRKIPQVDRRGLTSLTARWHRSINEIPEQQWNSLVGADAIPFYRWSWLEALESSGSIIPEH